jgi:hypothetical protein
MIVARLVAMPTVVIARLVAATAVVVAAMMVVVATVIVMATPTSPVAAIVRAAVIRGRRRGRSRRCGGNQRIVGAMAAPVVSGTVVPTLAGRCHARGDAHRHRDGDDRLGPDRVPLHA